MKDWVIIVVFLLILLVLADGIRRMRNERNGNIKVSRALKKSLKQPVEEDEPPAETPSFTSELPNGGARVIGQRDPSVRIPSIEKKPQAKSYVEKHKQAEPAELKASPRANREPQQTSLNLGQSVPMLMESVDDSNAHTAPLTERIEPGFSASRDEDLDDNYDGLQGENYENDDYEAEDIHSYTRDPDEDMEADTQLNDEDDETNEDEQGLNQEEDEGFEDDEYSHEDEDDYNQNEDEDYEDDESQSTSSAKNNIAEKQPAEPEEVLIINVMAHKGEMFNGADLLDIILKCGMRYGSMDIFHRHSDTKGEGALLFSMANMVKPGTFDLDAMDDFETPGVSLFMTLPINADSMQSFDLMADTARAISETLGGELKDEQRSVMTRQTLEHCRQRIRDFERMRLFRRPPR